MYLQLLNSGLNIHVDKYIPRKALKDLIYSSKSITRLDTKSLKDNADNQKNFVFTCGKL